MEKRKFDAASKDLSRGELRDSPSQFWIRALRVSLCVPRCGDSFYRNGFLVRARFQRLHKRFGKSSSRVFESSSFGNGFKERSNSLKHLNRLFFVTERQEIAFPSVSDAESSPAISEISSFVMFIAGTG